MNAPAFAPSAALATRSVFTPAAATSAAAAAPAAPASAPRAATTMAFSSIERVLTPDPVALPMDVSAVIAACYTQVFGNAYLMDSEREDLAAAESTLGIERNVREFVRALALSDGYRARFFEDVSMYRAVELAFKHLLGRAPGTKAEYAAAMAAYHAGGYPAFVAWFVDSAEYDENFGTQIVPYGIYMGCYPTSQQFNRSVAMRLAPGASDKGRSSMLQYAVCSDDSPNWLSIAKALPFGTERGTGLAISTRYASAKWNKKAPVRKGTKVPGGVVFY